MGECSLVHQLCNLKVELTPEWEPRLAFWVGWLIMVVLCEVGESFNMCCNPHMWVKFCADIIDSVSRGILGFRMI
jgi:hypothetical protein